MEQESYSKSQANHPMLPPIHFSCQLQTFKNEEHVPVSSTTTITTTASDIALVSNTSLFEQQQQQQKQNYKIWSKSKQDSKNLKWQRVPSEVCVDISNDSKRLCPSTKNAVFNEEGRRGYGYDWCGTFTRSCIEQKFVILITIILLISTSAVGTVFVMYVIGSPTNSANPTNTPLIQEPNGGEWNSSSMLASTSQTNENSNSNFIKIMPMRMQMQSFDPALPVSHKTVVKTEAPALAKTTKRKRHIPEVQSQSLINIRSTSDFLNLKIASTTKVNTLIIEKLVGNISQSIDKDSLAVFQEIKHIRISGPITEEWIQFILTSFSKVESLIINIDELCIGAKIRHRDSLPPIKLNHLESLQIENLHYCSITSWIFKWEIPNIKKLEIFNADLTKRTFQPIRNFLEISKDSLISLVISHSFICSECHFLDVHYSNIKNIKVLDELENPFIYE